MRLAALLLGIFGGLSGLSLAVYGHVAVSVLGGFGAMAAGQQDAAKVLLYGLPIASFVGASLAFSHAGASALLLLGSAAGWFVIGAHFGYGFNALTATTMILDGLAGLLAFAGASNSQGAADAPVSRVRVDRTSYEPDHSHDAQPSLVPSSPSDYDVRKWQALLKYDDELAKIAALFEPLGRKWSDRLAADYLAIGDKAYLPDIARKIMREARAERDQEEAAKRQSETQHARIQAEQAQHAPIQAEQARPVQPLQEIKRDPPKRLAAGLALLLAFFAVAGAGVWFLAPYLKPGPTTPAKSSIVSLGPALPDYAYQLPEKFPQDMTVLRSIIPDGLKSVEWIYDLSGVASPLRTIEWNGKSYRGGSVCKPHDCADNMFVFLVALDGSRAIATLKSSTIPGVQSVTLGPFQVGDLDRLQRFYKEIGNN